MRLGRAAAKRREHGGPQAVGRESLSVAGYAALKGMIFVNRARGCCERCSDSRNILDPDHAVPRSKGGPDAWWNIVILCRTCHQMKDLPFDVGRLLIEPQGDGRFKFLLVRGTKHAYEIIDVKWGGRGATYTEQRILAQLA